MEERKREILELLDESGMALRGLLYRLTLCEDAASDLMQDLFVRLWASKGFWKAENGFAFAWRVAVNLAFDWRKKRKASLGLAVEGMEADEGDCPVSAAICREEAARVLDAVGRLRRPGREVVVLRFVEGESFARIGERLGMNADYARSLCSKSVAKVRRMVVNGDSF